jgi:hypothetical protein
VCAFDPYRVAGGSEDVQNSLQEKAASAGGFSAPAAALALEELGVGTPAGWLHRGLLLQVCVDHGSGLGLIEQRRSRHSGFTASCSVLDILGV